MVTPLVGHNFCARPGGLNAPRESSSVVYHTVGDAYDADNCALFFWPHWDPLLTTETFSKLSTNPCNGLFNITTNWSISLLTSVFWLFFNLNIISAAFTATFEILRIFWIKEISRMNYFCTRGWATHARLKKNYEIFKFIVNKIKFVYRLNSFKMRNLRVFVDKAVIGIRK